MMIRECKTTIGNHEKLYFGKRNYTNILLEYTGTYKVARTRKYSVNDNEDTKQKVIFVKKTKFSAGFESFVDGRPGVRRFIQYASLYRRRFQLLSQSNF